MAVVGDRDRLARRILETVIVEVEPGDPRARRRRNHLAQRQRQHKPLLSPRLRGSRLRDSEVQMTLRRVRGFLLRLVRRRWLAMAIGLSLAVPAIWIEFSRGGAWWVDGLALIAGA